jgi:hypothetical protein
MEKRGIDGGVECVHRHRIEVAIVAVIRVTSEVEVPEDKPR